MTGIRFRRVFLGAAAAVVFASSVATAQEPLAPSEAYYRGVRAFFDGRLGESESMLSEAIIGDAYNPLPYYFRALVQLRTGCEACARGDMLIGAQLEASGMKRSGIGTALERIQGCDRLLLEKYRRDARANAALAGPEALPKNSVVTSSVSKTVVDTDREVLRQPIVIPLDELSRPGGPRAVPTQQPAEWNPNSGDSDSVAPQNGASPDPFQDDANAAPKAAPVEQALPAQTTPATVTPPQAEPAEKAPAEKGGAADEDPFKEL